MSSVILLGLKLNFPTYVSLLERKNKRELKRVRARARERHRETARETQSDSSRRMNSSSHQATQAHTLQNTSQVPQPGSTSLESWVTILALNKLLDLVLKGITFCLSHLRIIPLCFQLPPVWLAQDDYWTQVTFQTSTLHNRVCL